MKRTMDALRRLWRIGTCRHLGVSVSLTHHDPRGGGRTFQFCPMCGLLISYRRWTEKPAGPKPAGKKPKDESYKYN